VSPSTVRTLRARLARVMRAAKVGDRALSVSLTDDAELRALNREYAGEDHATDVLSFEQEAPLLGDIVISVETAARQARAAEHSLLAELFHLSVHGLAHLVGYDHATKRQERVMFAYEARLRARATARRRRRA
jgi:rRNA maturation RNase YbeY